MKAVYNVKILAAYLLALSLMSLHPFIRLLQPPHDWFPSILTRGNLIYDRLIRGFLTAAFTYHAIDCFMLGLPAELALVVLVHLRFQLSSYHQLLILQDRSAVANMMEALLHIIYFVFRISSKICDCPKCYMPENTFLSRSFIVLSPICKSSAPFVVIDIQTPLIRTWEQ
jgi:hypothetical protein